MEEPQTPIVPKKSFLVPIILILIVLALAAGGYFAYQKFFKKSNLNLLPAELDKYALGENADGFLIARNDKMVTDFLEEQYSSMINPIPTLDSFQNALILAKSEDGKETFAAVLQFKTNENAEEAKSWLTNFQRETDSLDIEDNVVILGKGEGLNGFNGSLYDNPLFEKINPDLLNSQLIFYFDNEAMPGYNSSLIFIRSAFFAGLDEMVDMESINVLSYTKSSGLFIEFLEDTLNVSLVNNLMDEKDLKAFEASLPSIEKLFINQPDFPDGAQVSVKLDGLNFLWTMKFPINSLLEVLKEKQAKAEGTSLDKNRITDLQRIENLLVKYILTTGEYPKVADCVENIDELTELWKESALLGVDGQFYSRGEQEFDGIVCASGYYYKIVSGKGFFLWAKMENEENGNFSLGPEAIDADYDFSEDNFSDGGEYYVLFFEDEYAVADEEKVER